MLGKCTGHAHRTVAVDIYIPYNRQHAHLGIPFFSRFYYHLNLYNTCISGGSQWLGPLYSRPLMCTYIILCISLAAFMTFSSSLSWFVFLIFNSRKLLWAFFYRRIVNSLSPTTQHRTMRRDIHPGVGGRGVPPHAWQHFDSNTYVKRMTSIVSMVVKSLSNQSHAELGRLVSVL